MRVQDGFRTQIIQDHTEFVSASTCDAYDWRPRKASARAENAVCTAPETQRRVLGEVNVNIIP